MPDPFNTQNKINTVVLIIGGHSGVNLPLLRYQTPTKQALNTWPNRHQIKPTIQTKSLLIYPQQKIILLEANQDTFSIA